MSTESSDPSPSRLHAAGRIARSASRHRVPPMAGEAAFFAALAVFPTLLTLVAVVRAATAVLGPAADAAAVHGLTELLRVVLTTKGTVAADAAGELLRSDGGGVLGVGTIAALALLARALRSILYALGTIADNPRSGLWPAAILLSAGTLLGAAVVLAGIVQDPLGVLGLPGAKVVWSVVRWPAAMLALFGWAVLLLRVGLGRRSRSRGRRGLLAGALVVAVGWFAASLVFPLYVAVVTYVTATLGALGGGLIMLIWLYSLMVVLYIGAEISVAIQGRALS